MNEAGQLKLLDEFRDNFFDEYSRIPLEKSMPGTYYLRNPNFGSVNGECLNCMIRIYQPRRMIEIGSGFSTLLARQAIEWNARESGVHCRLSSIDPYPTAAVLNTDDDKFEVIRQKVENVDLETFAELQENDILFIDSSHVLKIGSDVKFEYLELIPRVNKGVLVHIHDIFFPREYPRSWVLGLRRFWNEQYLVQAFLAFNREFEVLLAGAYLDVYHRQRLADAFPSSAGHDFPPSSFWMRRRL
jgi:predicted O-methyltransferase YrrM